MNRHDIMNPAAYERAYRRRVWRRAHLRADERYWDLLILAIGLAAMVANPLGQEIIRQLIP